MPNILAKTLPCIAILLVHILSPSQVPAQPWSAAKPLNDYAGKDDWQDTKPQLASNGNGVILAAWLNPGGLAISRSTSNGDSWTQVYGNEAFTLPQALAAKIAYAGNNTWVAVWIASTPNADKQVLATRSTDNGLTWSTPQLVLTGQTHDDLDIASDKNGTIIAVTPNITVRSGDFAATWQILEQAPYVNFPIMLERIAYNGAGKWFRVEGGLAGTFDLFYSLSVRTSIDGGQTWANFQSLENRFILTGHFPVMGAVAARDDTTVIALRRPAGGDYSSPALNVVVSQDNGTSWSDYRYVAEVAHDGQIDIDVDSQRWVITAKALESGNVASFVAHADPFAWQQMSLANNGVDDGDFASVAAIGNGEFISGFQVIRSNESHALFPELDVQSSRLPAEHTTWTATGYINPNANADIPLLNDSWVNIDMAPDGSAVAVWAAPLGSFWSFDHEVFFALSNDFGATWTNGAPINQLGFQADYGVAFRPRVLYVNPGKWFVYWQNGLQGRCTWSSNNGFNWASPVSFNAQFAGSNRNGLLLKAQQIGSDLTVISGSATGGSSWDQVTTFSETNINKLVHTGNSNWFIGGGQPASKGFTLVSSDDGQSWEKVENIAGLSIGYMEDIASNHKGTAIGVDAHVRNVGGKYYEVAYTWTTYDHGRTWHYKDIYVAPTIAEAAADNMQGNVAWVGGNTWAFAWNVLGKANFQVKPIDDRVWFSITDNNGADWAAPAALRPVPSPSAGQRAPEVAAQNGNVIIGWETYLENTIENAEFGYDTDLMYSTNKLTVNPSSVTDWQLF